MGARKKKIIAFVLSALVLPGTGQLYLKRKARGAAVTAASFVLAVYPMVRYLVHLQKTLKPYTGEETAVIRTVTAMEESWRATAGDLTICGYMLLALWLYGILDIIFGKGAENDHMQDRQKQEHLQLHL